MFAFKKSIGMKTQLKGNGTKGATWDLISQNGMEKKNEKNYAHSNFSFDFWPNLLNITFEIHQNTTMMAAFLCPAVCVGDVMSKARICS